MFNYSNKKLKNINIFVSIQTPKSLSVERKNKKKTKIINKKIDNKKSSKLNSTSIRNITTTRTVPNSHKLENKCKQKINTYTTYNTDNKLSLKKNNSESGIKLIQKIISGKSPKTIKHSITSLNNYLKTNSILKSKKSLINVNSINNSVNSGLKSFQIHPNHSSKNIASITTSSSKQSFFNSTLKNIKSQNNQKSNIKNILLNKGKPLILSLSNSNFKNKIKKK